MPRPIPTYLRGGKRADVPDEAKRPRRHVLSCPRICPKWEFDAWRALIKPQFKAAIEHRDPRQHWPAGAGAIVAAAIAHFDRKGRGRVAPDDVDDHLRITFPMSESRAAKALATELSRRLPDLWFLYDRQLVRAGTFYRFRRAFRPEIVPVKTSRLRYKRLPRDVYLTIQGRTDQD